MTEKQSKLKHALDLVDQGVNPHAAALQAGLKSPNAVYVALKKRRTEKEGLCPCCGKPLDEEQKPA